MLFGSALFTFAVVVLWVYCVFDVISTEESTIQNLPKTLWLLLVIFVPPIGPIAWLLLGRPSGAAWKPGSTERRATPPAPPVAPTGHPETRVSPEDHQAKREETLRRYNAEREELLKKREEELRQREEEFRRRELGEDKPS